MLRAAGTKIHHWPANAARPSLSCSKKAGILNKPTVVAAGSRKNAYDQFCTAVKNGYDAFLLVDAETLVAIGPSDSPWAHVNQRVGDGWARPPGATDDQIHFMNVIMETWLLADHAALKRKLGPKLNAEKLPAEGASLETKDKAAIYKALAAAIHSDNGNGYSKGKHSFAILSMVSPDKLRVLPWAARFLNEMAKL